MTETGQGEHVPRWRHRFDNFSRAFALLREGIETSEERDLSQLEKEGLIQRFEYTWELAWKVLNDYLSAQGVVLDTVTPKSVLRAAFAANIISDGEVWMEALDARNKMSQTYNIQTFEKVIADIRERFLARFDALHLRLLAEAAGDD